MDSNRDILQLANSNIEHNNPAKKARLKSLKKPVKKIKRYSSVCTSAYEQEKSTNQASALVQRKTPIADPMQTKKVSLKGMRLITLRLERNITQKELADALGLDKTLISQYEGEIIKPDYETVQKLADFFDVSLDYLIGSSIEEPESVEESKESYIDNNEEIVEAPMENQLIRPEYLNIAKEIQDAGIDVEDVINFINMIKKYRKG